MRKTRSTALALAFIAIAVLLGCGAPCAQAQRQVQLIDFTTTPWRYQTNGTDQGVAWRSPTFNESGWPVGLGLLGAESTPQFYPYPFNTSFIPFNPNIVTYYFRTHFDMAASNFIFPLTLVMSNLVDDGCVVYLNSNEVHRIRIPNGASFVTLATGAPSTEGAYEAPVNISTDSLRVGDNVLAVEVHQSAVGSGDIAHGLSLTAIVPTAVSITNQPQSQSTTLGSAVALSVGVAGGPALYQWQTNNGAGTFVNVPAATSNVYNFSPTAVGTWTFRLVASNGINTVLSSNATVTAIADTLGPVMLAATVLEEPTRTNRILITWSERLANASVCVGCGTNFTVVMAESNVTVAVSNVLYNPAGGPAPLFSPATILTMSTTNWHFGSNYFVSVNRVRDATGNVIAPDSRVPVAWPRNTNVILSDHAWSFHSASVFEPDIFNQPWYATNYVESSWWGWSPGPFCGGVVTATCFGPLRTEIGYQPEPSLFRTTFLVPTNAGFGLQLRFSYLVDDGVAFYLNGTELFRDNLPGLTTNLTASTKAIGSVQACRTNIVSVANLLPGKNWLAAAVFQSIDATAADTAFGLHLRHTGYFPGTLPDIPEPRLNIAAESTNRFRLWWDGPGYALEFTTNLVTGPGATGTWLEVTNMSNPFVDVLTGDRRFFRLHKPEP